MDTLWYTSEEIKELEQLDDLYAEGSKNYPFSHEALYRAERIAGHKEEIKHDVSEYIETLSGSSVCTLLDCIRFMVEHTLNKDKEAKHVWFTNAELRELLNKLFNMLELAKLQISLLDNSTSIMHLNEEVRKLKNGLRL